MELAALIEALLGAEGDTERRALIAYLDLTTLEAELVTAGNALLSESDLSNPEVIETLSAIADATEKVRAEVTTRAEEATAQEAEVTAIRDRLNASVGDDDEAEGEEADGDDKAEDDDEDDDETAAVETPAPAKVPSLSVLRQFQPADTHPPVEEVAPRVRIVAAPDVPGMALGGEFPDIHKVAEAVIARRSALGKSRGGNVVDEKIGVVSFKYLDALVQASDDPFKNIDILRRAREPGALTASGGFCAPVETVYDFVKVNQPDGLVQDFLPTVGLPRGSISYPTSPDIRNAFAAPTSTAYSATDDENSVPKTRVTVACPEFVTCEAGAEYSILGFGNFQTRAYPEWVEHWIRLALDAHQHLVSAKLMNQMLVLSGAPVPVGPNAGATSSILRNLDLAGADLRADLRMGESAQLEVVLPSWLPDAIRSDLASASKGTLETLAVTNAQINSWIAARNLTPRYVTDWTQISANNATGAAVWPAGLEFLLYPPGTFVRGDMGTLDLGIVRDSVRNATNDYDIFVETFEVVCRPGIESRRYSVSLCVNGAFSADQNLNCAGIDIPGS